MARTTRTPPRSGLRLAELKQRRPGATKMLNVKVPADIAERVEVIAAHVGATRTEVIVALLNTALEAAQRRTRT